MFEFYIKKILEPQSRKFGISFQTISVIYKIQSKSHRVTKVPFKIVQEWPYKIPFYIYTIPAFTWKSKQLKKRNFLTTNKIISFKDEKKLTYLIASWR